MFFLYLPDSFFLSVDASSNFEKLLIQLKDYFFFLGDFNGYFHLLMGLSGVDCDFRDARLNIFTYMFTYRYFASLLGVDCDFKDAILNIFTYRCFSSIGRYYLLKVFLSIIRKILYPS
jgi:hypothetical protein